VTTDSTLERERRKDYENGERCRLEHKGKTAQVMFSTLRHQTYPLLRAADANSFVLSGVRLRVFERLGCLSKICFNYLFLVHASIIIIIIIS
jgi:hypothetical protein